MFADDDEVAIELLFLLDDEHPRIGTVRRDQVGSFGVQTRPRGKFKQFELRFTPGFFMVSAYHAFVDTREAKLAFERHFNSVHQDDDRIGCHRHGQFKGCLTPG